MWTKESLYVNMVLCFPGWFDFRIIGLYPPHLCYGMWMVSLAIIIWKKMVKQLTKWKSHNWKFSVFYLGGTIIWCHIYSTFLSLLHNFLCVVINFM